MSYRSLTAALTLYRSGTLDLEGAADHCGAPTAKVASELRSRGIPVRKAGQEVLGGRRIN